jgi:hypothetical protein
MRRFTAFLFAGLGLLAATVAWSAFATSFTVFDPDRSERVADALIEEPAVRDALATALAKALRSGLEEGVAISDADLESIARRVLDDPRTLEVLRTAIVGAHQRLVGDAEGPVRLDTAALAQAGRDALMAAHPELAASLATAPPPAVELPTDKLPELAPVRGRLGQAGRAAGLAAVLLLAAAFLVTSDRPGVLRRMGRSAVGIGLSSAVAGWLLPQLMSAADGPLAVVGALGVAAVGPLVAPAVILVAAGAGAIVAARTWRARAFPAVAPVAPPASEAVQPPFAA